jgi:hypothetical protein
MGRVERGCWRLFAGLQSRRGRARDAAVDGVIVRVTGGSAFLLRQRQRSDGGGYVREAPAMFPRRLVACRSGKRGEATWLSKGNNMG